MLSNDNIILYGMFRMWQDSEYFEMSPEEFIATAIRGQIYADAHPPFWEKPQYGDD